MFNNIKTNTIMDFIELARSRYSCKKFDSRQIRTQRV